MNPMSSKMVVGLEMELQWFVNSTELNNQCREDIKTLLKYIQATPFVTTQSVGVKNNQWKFMKELLRCIEVEGLNGPCYGLKSQIEKIMRYF